MKFKVWLENYESKCSNGAKLLKNMTIAGWDIYISACNEFDQDVANELLPQDIKTINKVIQAFKQLKVPFIGDSLFLIYNKNSFGGTYSNNQAHIYRNAYDSEQHVADTVAHEIAHGIYIRLNTKTKKEISKLAWGIVDHPIQYANPRANYGDRSFHITGEEFFTVNTARLIRKIIYGTVKSIGIEDLKFDMKPGLWNSFIDVFRKLSQPDPESVEKHIPNWLGNVTQQ